MLLIAGYVLCVAALIPMAVALAVEFRIGHSATADFWVLSLIPTSLVLLAAGVVCLWAAP
jgi:hypothetical protein